MLCIFFQDGQCKVIAGAAPRARPAAAWEGVVLSVRQPMEGGGGERATAGVPSAAMVVRVQTVPSGEIALFSDSDLMYADGTLPGTAGALASQGADKLDTPQADPSSSSTAGCDGVTCQSAHISDGPCLVCGKPWGPHSNHRCPDGRQGSWRISRAPPAGAVRGIPDGPWIPPGLVEKVEVSTSDNSRRDERCLSQEQPDTYWQSDGRPGMHTIQIFFSKPRPGHLTELGMVIDEDDDSYCPKRVRVIVEQEGVGERDLGSQTIPSDSKGPRFVSLLKDYAGAKQILSAKVCALIIETLTVSIVRDQPSVFGHTDTF